MHISQAIEQRPAMNVSELLIQNPVAGEKKAGSKRFWTNKEIAVVETFYPTEGIEGCLARLPGRSASAIYGRAGILKKLRRQRVGRAGVPRKRYHPTPEIDRVIKAAFERPKKNRSDFKKLAATLNLPYRWIMERGAKLTNTAMPRFKELPWTQPEIDILLEHAHLCDPVLQRKLARAGFHRTDTAVHIKLKRLKADREDPHHYNAKTLASLLGVDGKTVTLWIEKGLIRATRKGDFHWIHWRAVKRFVVENANLVDLRKVDPTWFIDLLAVRE